MRSAIGQVRTAVAAQLTDIEAGELVLVACSGGRDSLALAVATRELSVATHWRIGAVIVDHGLQAGSDTVAAVVAQVLRDRGLDPVLVVRVDVASGGGPEMAARTSRYAALDRIATATGSRVVLLGHTRDDQAETVLLGLARGSGLRSLAGMPARSGSDGRYRRPLLDVTRETTGAACAELELPFWDDPHNADPTYARSRVRHRVLPVLEAELGPGVREALTRTAELADADASALEAWTERVWTAIAHPGEGLDVGALMELPTAIRTRLLRRAAVAAGAPAGRLTLAHIRAVEELVTAWRGQGDVALPGSVSVARRYGRLDFAVPSGKSQPVSEPSSGDPWTPTT
jgi:tRNA(Ile)-lysidine synthase